MDVRVRWSGCDPVGFAHRLDSPEGAKGQEVALGVAAIVSDAVGVQEHDPVGDDRGEHRIHCDERCECHVSSVPGPPRTRPKRL